MLDERQIKALHIEALSREELAAEGHEPHILHQASTIAALLDGAYDGDLTLGELLDEGNLGLGTTNGLDGELIILDGECSRAKIDGTIERLAPEVKTPFAVVADFQPTLESRLEGPLNFELMTEQVDGLRPEGTAACAVRIDGRFTSIRARSVPRQEMPYRPLPEVIEEQKVFEIGECEGTLVGFRFPDYAEGIEVGGWHLHFIDTARQVGGHVMEVDLIEGAVQIDPSNELHAEMPPGVGLGSVAVDDGIADRIAKVERSNTPKAGRERR